MSEHCLIFEHTTFANGFFNTLLELIKQAAHECGYEAHRIDRDHTGTAIIRRIVEGIAEAEMIVADLSGSNPNVLYEVGIAHTMQRRVVLVTDDPDPASLPFDLRGYPVHPIPAAERGERWAALVDAIRIRARRDTRGGPVEETLGRFAIRFGEPLFLRRAFALVLDGLLLSLLSYAIGLLVPVSVKSEGTESMLLGVIFLACVFLYFAVLIWWFGTTPGKRALGLRVETWDSQSVGLSRACVRTLGYGLSALPLGAGFWFALMGPAFMTFHDRVSRTRVVRRQPGL